MPFSTSHAPFSEVTKKQKDEDDQQDQPQQPAPASEDVGHTFQCGRKSNVTAMADADRTIPTITATTPQTIAWPCVLPLAVA